MRARIPADVDMADRILGGMTARQLAILGVHGLVLWGLWAAVGERLDPYVFGALSVPVVVLAFVWATVKAEGTTIERLAFAGLRFVLHPRRRVPAPEGLATLPRWWRPRTTAVAPLELPAESVASEGHLGLGEEGVALLCRASSLNFALRSEREQRALIDGFGRLLNSLDAPTQFVVRSERTDLRAVVDSLEAQASALPHPALEEAAREHAAFLRSLAARRDVLVRRVLVCLRERGEPEGAAARLDRRAEEASAVLRGLGVRLGRLGGGEAAGTLTRACDPEGALPLPGVSLPGEVVTVA